MKIILLTILVLSICQSIVLAASHASVSEDAGSDRYCENLRLAEQEMPESEIMDYQRFGLAKSPVIGTDEVFYLIHERIGGGCRDRFMAGRLLHRISMGEVSDDLRRYAREKESYVTGLVEYLWETGSISLSDLDHQRELLIVYEGFNLEGRSRLLEVALRVEGMSPPVIFALWTLPRSVTAGFVSRVLTEFGRAPKGRDKLLLGLTLLRLKAPPSSMIRVEDVIDETELSTEQRVKVDGIVRRVAIGEDVAYADLLDLGFVWED